MVDNLHTGDRALLDAALSGKGVELTPALIAQIQKSITNRQDLIAVEYPRLVEECPYETKLAVTAWVFEHICMHAVSGGSFRYLIYERLGFGPDAYLPLYLAGGMTISNEFDLSQENRDDTLHT